MSENDFTVLHIYGDNIIECERTLDLILKGFQLNEPHTEIHLLKSNLIAPSFQVLTDYNKYLIKLFPGTQRNRWNKDIYTDFIINKGGIISEGADAILTRFNGEKEEALLGLEFSAALPAGNNAWQRSGRAYSFSLAGIPYFYLCDFGGNELNSKGEIISSRFPNPALILSYILNSLRNDVPNMLVYQQSSVASSEIISDYEGLLDGNIDLSNIFYSILTNNNKEDIYLDDIINKNIQIMNNILLKKDSKLTKMDIQKRVESINYENVLELIKKDKEPWKKKLSKAKYHPTVSNLFEILASNSYGIFSNNLPFCLLPSENKQLFLEDLKKLYPEIRLNVLSQWFEDKDDVVVCSINGFKPGGNDSRPDRGLIPFARMLVGSEVPILSIIFGPVPNYYYDQLDNDMDKLALSNGLWSAIINFSDAIFIDSKTLSLHDPKTYIINPKNEKTKDIEDIEGIVVDDTILGVTVMDDEIAINLYPDRLGENDVDTLIHIFFSRLIDGVFESFCNPPGGDWSGISILNGTHEYRYVSLPRLSSNSKRPDHVYQFSHEGESVLLSIESKENLSSLLKEKNVGELMNVYLQVLLDRTANARRTLTDLNWIEDNSSLLNINDYIQKSGVAYMAKNDSELEPKSIDITLLETQSDLAIIVKFDKKEFKTLMYFYTKDRILYDLLHTSITTLKFNEETQFILIDPENSSHIPPKDIDIVNY